MTRRLRKDGATYLRPVLPGQPGAPAGALHPPPFPGAVVQGRSDALPSASRACSTTSTAAWGRASQGLTTDEAYAGGRARREAVPGRPARRSGARSLRAPHGARARRDALRGSGRHVSRPDLHRGGDRRAAEDGRRRRATTSTSSPVYAEPPLVALNLFHLRNGQIVDRREFFWEDQEDVRTIHAGSSSRRC